MYELMYSQFVVCPRRQNVVSFVKNTRDTAPQQLGIGSAHTQYVRRWWRQAGQRAPAAPPAYHSPERVPETTECIGFYPTLDGCRHCHHYCRECSDSGPLKCTSCPPRFMLDGGLCMECLGSQYYDAASETCKACDATCRTCLGPGQFSCTGCSMPNKLDRLNNQCVPCCSNSTAGRDCCHCNVETGDCINSSPAGKRRIAEPSALRAATAQQPAAASAGAAVVAVAAVAATLFLLVLLALQARSGRRDPQSERAKGVVYSPLACADDADVAVLTSRTAFPTKDGEEESLLEHCT
ncbi:unnamed protein product [Plutella xylostella]|uniref:(diamondback moth) hypothetical protein n=1 Tax=Plutella xylostella TaxID=51655 RepID=A0A8S4FX74_PLUXY|nr:unnamed protein product [Plutella xylostella]